jgi:hypothetical protein
MTSGRTEDENRVCLEMNGPSIPTPLAFEKVTEQNLHLGPRILAGNGGAQAVELHPLKNAI